MRIRGSKAIERGLGWDSQAHVLRHCESAVSGRARLTSSSLNIGDERPHLQHRTGRAGVSSGRIARRDGYWTKRLVSDSNFIFEPFEGPLDVGLHESADKAIWPAHHPFDRPSKGEDLRHLISAGYFINRPRRRRS